MQRTPSTKGAIPLQHHNMTDTPISPRRHLSRHPPQKLETQSIRPSLTQTCVHTHTRMHTKSTRRFHARVDFFLTPARHIQVPARRDHESATFSLPCTQRHQCVGERARVTTIPTAPITSAHRSGITKVPVTVRASPVSTMPCKDQSHPYYPYGSTAPHRCRRVR